VREIVTLKRKVDPLLRGGRFRDGVGLTTSEGVRATVLVGGGVTYIPFVNPGATQGATVTLAPEPGRAALKGAARAWLVGGADPVDLVATAPRAGVLTLALPAAAAGVVELR
jgi:hypothetical protein